MDEMLITSIAKFIMLRVFNSIAKFTSIAFDVKKNCIKNPDYHFYGISKL